MSREIISPTVPIRVSGRMDRGRAQATAECMNRMVDCGKDVGAPHTPFIAAPLHPEYWDQEDYVGSWAVFVRNNAIRAL